MTLSLFLRAFIHIFNIIYMVFGVACLVEANTCLGKEYEILLCRSMLPLLVVLVKITGYLLLLVAIVGSTGVCCKKRNIIKTYTAGLSLALVFMMSCAWKGFLYLAQVDTILDRNVKLTIQNNYGFPEHSEWTSGIDYMQKQIQCCGYIEAEDWKYSKYFTDTTPSIQESRGSLVVPRSCCIDALNPLCATDRTATIIYTNGCKAPLKIEFQDTLISIGCIGSGMTILLVMNILLVFCLLSKKDEKVHPRTELVF